MAEEEIREVESYSQEFTQNTEYRAHVIVKSYVIIYLRDIKNKDWGGSYRTRGHKND